MSNGWEKRYQIKIVIEQIECQKGDNTPRNVPKLFHKYVTDKDGKPWYFGADKSMLLAYGWLFDKLQGFGK